MFCRAIDKLPPSVICYDTFLHERRKVQPISNLCNYVFEMNFFYEYLGITTSKIVPENSITKLEQSVVKAHLINGHTACLQFP